MGRMRAMRGRVVVAWALLAFVLAPAAWAKEPFGGLKPPGAVISSANHHATDAGHEVLAKGGNAFDAAIAVSASLSVTEPISSGIGAGAKSKRFQACGQSLRTEIAGRSGSERAAAETSRSRVEGSHPELKRLV